MENRILVILVVGLLMLGIISSVATPTANAQRATDGGQPSGGDPTPAPTTSGGDCGDGGQPSGGPC